MWLSVFHEIFTSSNKFLLDLDLRLVILQPDCKLKFVGLNNEIITLHRKSMHIKEPNTPNLQILTENKDLTNLLKKNSNSSRFKILKIYASGHKKQNQ